MENIFIILISSLISGILGVAITVYYNLYQEKRKLKIETLRQFVGYRFDLSGENFSKAINEIFVTFTDSKKVIESLEIFHDTVTSGKKELVNDKLIILFKEMCKDLKIDLTNYNDSIFLKAFNIKK